MLKKPVVKTGIFPGIVKTIAEKMSAMDHLLLFSTGSANIVEKLIFPNCMYKIVEITNREVHKKVFLTTFPIKLKL